MDSNAPPSPEEIHVDENNGIPNHPRYPALLYRSALEAEDGDVADRLEEAFTQNGWTGCWRWGVYDFHHFHSNAHEVLGVARGEARLTIGGPDGETLEVAAGDVLVLPAGTGHKNEGASGDFLVVGAYPEGQTDHDLVRGGGSIDEAVRNRITQTPVPAKDPVRGEQGGVRDHWKK